jgi:hypothetical protein
MEDFLNAVKDFFIQIYENVMIFINLLLDGAGVVYGALRAILFIIIFALIFGFVLNNRRFHVPRWVIVIFVVIVLIIVVIIRGG